MPTPRNISICDEKQRTAAGYCVSDADEKCQDKLQNLESRGASNRELAISLKPGLSFDQKSRAWIPLIEKMAIRNILVSEQWIY